MADRDFYLLMNEFNTVPGAIQNYGGFCDDFERIARNAENADDFRKALKAHRETQLCFYKTILHNISQEVVISHRHIPKKHWNALLDLLTQDVNGLSWQSPVSLQDLINALQLIYPRLVSTAPLAIKPPTPAASPSTDSPQLSSDGSNRKPSRPTRTNRAGRYRPPY